MSGPRSGPRPYRRNGQTFVCQYCQKEFYRKASFIKRGITKTCGDRECISKSMQGDGNPYWGKNHSEEVKIALRAAKTARPPNKFRGHRFGDNGEKHSPETRAKMAANMRRRWAENRDGMLALFQKSPPKPREEQRYRRNFTPWQRQNWRADKCLWCDSIENLVLDHIIPVADGGINLKENCQTLCQPCNIWKSTYIDRPRYLAGLASKAA